MDINHEFSKFINMQKTVNGSYKPGVELGNGGKALKLSHGSFLKTLNVLAMAAAITVLTVTIGIRFSYLWQESPVLIASGNVIALVFLLIGQVATFFWYLITGMKEPMNAIADALPTGDVAFQCAVCFFPLTLTVLLIGLRVYMKIYVSKRNAYILLCSCIGVIALSAYILNQW